MQLESQCGGSRRARGVLARQKARRAAHPRRVSPGKETAPARGGRSPAQPAGHCLKKDMLFAQLLRILPEAANNRSFACIPLAISIP